MTTTDNVTSTVPDAIASTSVDRRQGEPLTTSRRSSRARRRVWVFLASLAAVAATITVPQAASAASVPYATAGRLSCVDGTGVSPGRMTGTNPYWFYPASPTLAARFPGELDYYRMDVQLYTTSGWTTVVTGSWNAIYASYNYQGPDVNFPWSFANDRGSWDINTSGYYRLLYTMYWSPTGRQGSAPSAQCYVNKPAGGGGWGMW